MIYRITHTTRFKYPAPAYDSHNELRMKPWSRDGQRCLEFAITASQPFSLVEYDDFFGNRTHALSVTPVHKELTIVARSKIEVIVPDAPELAGVTFAEFLREDAIRNQTYFEYLNASHYIPFSERLRKFFWMARPEEKEDVAAYVSRMVAYVRDQFEYETTKTNVHSSLNDILHSGGGVCQDFAHLSIGILRLAGVPARYVSGYLAPAAARAAVDISAQASHAWLEAWLPGIGWSGFDPTHRCATDGRHIGVAVGRDYADVPPLRGVFSSDDGTSEMSVDLNVEYADNGGSRGGPPAGQTQQ